MSSDSDSSGASSVSHSLQSSEKDSNLGNQLRVMDLIPAESLMRSRMPYVNAINQSKSEENTR